MNYIPNIPETGKKRVVIIGAGFAGLKVARKLVDKGFQMVILDRDNFHLFQPLLYQVATAGLEPSAISFPVRKILQNDRDVHFRIAELLELDSKNKELTTNIGLLKYDLLILAMGAKTNFFGKENIQKQALSMKSTSDAILIRNTIIANFEQALLETKKEKIKEYLNIVLVGGGPTGVEMAGALAEMRKYIFPKDYPELDVSNMRILLYEAADRLLVSMSDKASRNALKYLRKLGVEVHLNTGVVDYDGLHLKLSDGSTVASRTTIWAAGVKVKQITGIPDDATGHGNRIMVDRYNRVLNLNDVFAVGDICIMETKKYPQGHPQVAQVAIQQAKNLARNIIRLRSGSKLEEFEYTDKGSLATIGRNLAVADLPIGKIKGFAAWILWTFVHLFYIIGVRNRLMIFLTWIWNYFTYDQSLRLLIRPKDDPRT